MRFATVLAWLPVLTAALPTTSNGADQIADTIVARAPPEAKAVLKSVTSSGTGCNANSAAFVFKDDATVVFDDMAVDNTMTDKSKRCLVTIDVQLDSKWKYTINKATSIRGYVEAGSASQAATFKVTYTAGGKTSETSGAIMPTTDTNWAFQSTSQGATSAYGGGVASIDVSLRLSPEPNKQAAVTIDSLDIKFDYSK